MAEHVGKIRNGLGNPFLTKPVDTVLRVKVSFRVERFLRNENGSADEQQLSHGGDEGEFFGFSVFEQSLIERSQEGVAVDGDESRHIRESLEETCQIWKS